MNILGPILFETSDGHPEAQVTYTKHPSLRPFQIMFRGVWHVQNRQQDGMWVYRALPGTPGTAATDPWVVE